MRDSRENEQKEPDDDAISRQIVEDLAPSSNGPKSNTKQETSGKRLSETDQSRQNYKSPIRDASYKKLIDEAAKQIEDASRCPPSPRPKVYPAETATGYKSSQTDSAQLRNQSQSQQQGTTQPYPYGLNQSSVMPVPSGNISLMPPYGLGHIATTFDIQKCWDNLKAKYHQVPLQALVITIINLYLKSEFHELDVVKATLINCQEHAGCWCDSKYVYTPRQFQKDGYLSWGWWRSKDSDLHGIGCLSLHMHITGATEVEAMEECARIFGLDLSNEMATQLDCHDESTWIPCPSKYLVNEYYNPIIKLTGQPAHRHCFHNASGEESYWLFGWQLDKIPPIWLFYTARQDKRTDVQFWEFFAPPVKHLIFNRHLINRNPSSKVIIHDQIRRAAQYSSNTFMEAHTWAGDLPWASELDWEVLKGRDVSFVFDENNPDSMKIGAELIQKFKKFGTEITLLHVKDQGQGETLTEKWPDEHFYEVAFRRHDLDLGNKISRPEVLSIVLDELPAGDTSIDWLVEPLIRREDFVLIAAEAGVGKTFVAIDIGLMIVTGESIASWLKVTAPQSVLFIDTELSKNTFKGRFQKIKLNYANTESTKEFSYISIYDDTRTKLDLTKIEDQEWVEHKIAACKPGVVVIDNLGGIMPYQSEQQPKEWEKISKFIKSLNKRKIAVLLVHHLTKGRKYRGTNKILDDSDLAIRLERPEIPVAGKKLIEWSFDKPRHLDETQQFPFTIEYVSESGKMRRNVTHKHSVPDPNPSEISCVSQAEIIQHNLSDFEVEILTVVRTSEEGWVKAGHFKSDANGRKRSNVTETLKKLCAKGLLVRNVKTGNGTIYYDPARAPLANETPTVGGISEVKVPKK